MITLSRHLNAPCSATAVLCSLLVTLSMTVAGPAFAEDNLKPVDKPYPGVIELQVDATNINQKIFSVHEHIPARPGKLTLLYPQWLPGTHSPEGPLAQLAGLTITADHHPLTWKRDEVNVFAFEVTVPQGAAAIDLAFQFLSPLDGNQGAIVVTPEMLAVQWEKMLLYPQGYFSHGITVRAGITLPPDWQYASALETSEQHGQKVQFKPTSLEDFIDSPLYAGQYFKKFDLDPGAKIPVYLDVFADDPENLVAKPEQIEFHRALLQQAYRLYGSHHFDHYDFLVAASDNFGFGGLEHHQSGENLVKPGYFTEWDKGLALRGYLIPHEFSHSWNGKFRRPAGQLTANYNAPMQNSLLWVYEGQTEYWGFILAARSGLLSAEQVRDSLAMVAASYDVNQARSWRALQDTTNDPVINQRRPLGWRNWQRAEDYYDEGQLIWLDADTKIRELSDDRRSLNDFASAFFGVENGRHVPLTYTFDDVVKTLNAIQPFDWAQFLRARLDGHGPGAPLDGLARSGWKLVFTDKPNEYDKSVSSEFNQTDYWYSLGFTVGRENHVNDVMWGGLAFRAGLSANAVLLAVNGREYKEEVLKKAIGDAQTGKDPIELLFKKDGRYQTLHLDYHGGLKYPQLVRIEGTRDRLTEILNPLP